MRRLKSSEGLDGSSLSETRGDQGSTPGAEDGEPCGVSTCSELDTVPSPSRGKEHIAFEAVNFLSSPEAGQGRGGSPVSCKRSRPSCPVQGHLITMMVKCPSLQVSRGREEEPDDKLLLVNEHA